VPVFDTPAGRLGIAISLDAFIDTYVRRLDDQGAVLVLQPDANPGFWANPGPIWQPDEWTGSVLGMLQRRYSSITYNATSMMVGGFFPGTVDATGNPSGIVFDGQSSITKRSTGAARRGFVAMASNLGLTGRFLAVGPWAFADPGKLRNASELNALRDRCGSTVAPGLGPRQLGLEQRRQILRDCQRSMMPGGRNADGYRENLAIADVTVPIAR
jgi:hypothetical protein